jgi:peptidoglycan/LPS O-acetylase OafA/YrhL
LGGLLAVYKEEINITGTLPLGLFLLCFLFKGWSYERYLIYTCLFMSSVYVASKPLVVKFKKMPDLSYGVFLWGWPIQQVVSKFIPGIGFYTNLLVCLTLSLLMAYISWIVIEKRALVFGRYIISLLPKKFADIGCKSI